MNPISTETKPHRNVMLAIAVLLAMIVASYWTVLLRLAKIWDESPDYSHGYLVPLFSGYLVYRSRERWLPLIEAPKSLWAILIGVGLIVAALSLRAAGILGRALPVEGVSLPFLLAGVFCLVGGVRSVTVNAAALVFLLFMLPMPSHMNRVLRGELQKYATQGSVFVLQTIGVPATNQGNVIKLPNSEVGVVEACSGLRILASLGAMAFAICVLMEKRWLNRGLILLSVLPIALIVNIARIVITSLGHEYAPEWSEKIHDGAGWLMIVLAVILLVAVQRYFAALLPTEPEPQPRSNRIPTKSLANAS
jgi:exosortase